ncbi:MAG: hypothetical protein K2L17_07080 [Muribaculaceae bacterium]|nr:hypothetical protein [Muribaculaceae bacterium]
MWGTRTTPPAGTTDGTPPVSVATGSVVSNDTQLERRGPESKKGQNDTYFVYNDLGQLRYVLNPSYQENADLSDFVYEYRYDQYGNVVYKAIPGAGHTQYWYDRAGRLAYMQDANLRSKSLYRFYLYDKAGRQAIQGVCKVCTRDETVNFATYTGGTGGFMSTGYTLGNSSRIQQATLETVSYYDNHTFASYLDTDIAKSSTQSCKGMLTGSVVYNSDGTKSSSALYYDAKGQVIESREKTSFGTLRTTTSTYTYSGQPLKTTMKEGTVTLITENTYDTWSGLLTATDVTVNGTKQRVSAVTYDDLGRIASVVRGAEQNSGGKVSYKYNIHGQTTSITGPGFSQNLYYADGPGNKLYNGSVSAMAWSMGDLLTRGYKYSYNDYNWLTDAVYGEWVTLNLNKNKYSEKFTSFTRNGGIRAMIRNGLKADGTYGNVDFLNITYRGNQIYHVAEGAPAVTQNGSMDFPGGAITSLQFTYNDFGALTADQSSGITDITYDNFGNPLRISYASGAYTDNVYSASGKKLRTQHGNGMAHLPAQDYDGTVQLATTPPWIQRIEYRGNVIYRDGKVDMVLFPGGYATINGTVVTFHYYTQDYLGNNRAVINGSTGAIEQTVAYYPYGGVIADLGTNQTSGQPYKYGCKELITANGLNEYDFGARQYYSAVPGFTRPDRMCEKYYWLSPYLYCANNPVNFVDPTGNIIEMPKGSTTEQILTVMWNMQQITDDKLVFNTQKDGSIRIKIGSMGNGNKSTGTRLIRRLNSSAKTMTIVPTNNSNGEKRESNIDSTNGKGTNTTVLFNPDSDPDIPILDKNTGNVISGRRPSYIGLAHEMIHADRDMRGEAFYSSEEEYHSFTDKYGNCDVERIPKEEAATIGFNHIKKNGITENAIRKESGIPPRGTYRSYINRNKR